jgi:hypothetical protein
LESWTKEIDPNFPSYWQCWLKFHGFQLICWCNFPVSSVIHA